MDVADIATVAHVCTKDVIADTDNIVGRGDVHAGRNPKCKVVVARRVAKERRRFNGSVEVASGIAVEGINLTRRVVVTGAVVQRG